MFGASWFVMSTGWKIKFGFITVTISPLTRKILTVSLNKVSLVVANKVRGIVKVFDIIPSIPFRFIPGPANEVFNCAALAFSHYLFVKQTIYLEGFDNVNVTVDKHSRRYMRTGVIKGVIDWRRCWL